LSLRIATWNINSLRLRLDNVARIVETLAPDVLCLQEIKVQDEHFPHERLQALGYRHVLA
jgi:exodeoxyribonuclease-3